MATMADPWIAAHPGHHDEDVWSSDALLNNIRAGHMHSLMPGLAKRQRVASASPLISMAYPFAGHTFGSTSESDDLRRRLDNANLYFHRKATEVFSDDVALRLLAAIYEIGVVDLEDFDACEYGVPLAKLTAANFCEIGAKVIYITESGQQFIESIG